VLAHVFPNRQGDVVAKSQRDARREASIRVVEVAEGAQALERLLVEGRFIARGGLVSSALGA
jgi:hypothetical protein